jgi:hypothetical protein
MGSNAVFFAWNRAIPGRERIGAEHFGEFVEYLEGRRKAGAIESFEAVFLDPHGGDLNGFFLIRAAGPKLDALLASDEWQEHTIRAALHLEGSGAVRGVTGEAVMQRMELWKRSIPS